MVLAKPALKTVLDRPAQLRGLAMLALLGLVLAILVGMIWRNLSRLDTIQAYVSYSHLVQDAGLGLQQVLVDTFSGIHPGPRRLQEQSEKIRKLIREDAHLDQDTPARLGVVDSALREAGGGSLADARSQLSDAVKVMHLILSAETDQRERVLEEISRDTLAELELATGTLTVILVTAWIFLRRRILAPLNDLRHLLSNLAQEDFVPMDTKGLDPLLVPVFDSYNLMVRNLGELEEAKRMYALSLEAEVRSATQALLEQQRSLARAERLAAIGELAAAVAHELRNPLAGIQMSCQNLRNEIRDPDQAERLDLIGAELKRMARLLNNLLEQGRQSPLPACEFNLAELVRELLALTRYQVPAEIMLEQDIPADLECYLPESNLRQILLNLVLNAAQALVGNPGTIRLVAQREEDKVLLEVIDDGPGFSPEILAKGIRLFGTGRVRGTGLGLAIVQRFVRELGGQIRLSNQTPHGACVSITLPLRSSQP
ncbi:sensor histidine kinase [Methyloterricola oryzae]|uniref:sensor histidine kinase n=1 Tax=Methyloterricola oryzae TaxID=1495050 RepID=UPI0005EB5F12|nr:ATP-binding protein [Methyloterricola oryzae]